MAAPGGEGMTPVAIQLLWAQAPPVVTAGMAVLAGRTATAVPVGPVAAALMVRAMAAMAGPAVPVAHWAAMAGRAAPAAPPPMGARVATAPMVATPPRRAAG